MARSRSTSSLPVRLAAVALLCFLCPLAATGAPAAPVDHRSSRLVKQGIALHNGGAYDKAIRLFQQAFKDDPRLTKTLLLIGASYLNLGRAEEVLDYYERYEREEKHLRPEDHERLRGYYDEAAVKMQLDYDADPKRVELLLFSGRAHQDLGRIEEAVIRYERFGREAPIHNRRRERMRGYYEQAHSDLLRKYEESHEPEIFLLLGRVATGLGRPEEAARYAARYRELRPPPAPVEAAPKKDPEEKQARAPAPVPPVRMAKVDAPRLWRGRPLWRAIAGGAVGVAGLGLAGFGISAISVDGSCIQPPGQTCVLDYATHDVGLGLIVGGLVVSVGGAVLVAIPGPRP